MRWGLFAGALALSAGLVSAADASVVVYTSQAAFAAATTIQHTATFEGLPTGHSPIDPLIQDGVSFHSLPGGHPVHDLYVTYAGQPLTLNAASFATQALSANGDENFQIQLSSGLTFGAIGLDYATNAFNAPVVSLFTSAGVLIGAFAVPQAPQTVGFFGLISSTAIGYATTTVDRGYISDTAIDNVRIGPLQDVAGVPEPAAWALMIAGFGLAGIALRRRRSAVLAT